ncbi:structural maintenance of chromosomes 4-like protein gluon [Brevipalpus obovatus]|uniref:structural maintenance of chromosomes 4-like protein gluon n=1 Tax=Brevipalpus obovatus TaxID=246614 RepID=UPI003D9ED785
MPAAVQDPDPDDEDFFDEEEGGEYIEGVYVPPPPSKVDADALKGVRLLIQNIENINFKSYAGTQILGPFHKSFTAIVGPNGSGKSNVIDSMLFVFGFRASKLRLKKLSSLIHKSENFPDFDHCSVIVHFAKIEDKEGDDFSIIEGSQFSVSRTVHKNNQSYYKIHDHGEGKSSRVVQFKEVANRLKSYGIDLRYNRFLILQGEVEQIALMKPKAETEHDTGMLEFLEDIIGSNILKAPISQLMSKLEAKNEIRSEKMNRVRIVEKEKNSLEKARNEAIAYLEEENRLTLEKNKLFQLRKADAKAEMSEVLKNFEIAKEKHDKIKEKCGEIDKRRQEDEEKLKKMQDDMKNAAKLADDLKEEFTAMERKDSQLTSKAKHTKEKYEKLAKQLKKAHKDLEELKLLPEKLQAEVEELEEDKTSLEEKKTDADSRLNSAMEEMKNETGPLQEEKDKLESKVLELQSGVNEARSSLGIVEEELSLFKNRERTEKAKLDQLKMKFESNVSNLNEKEKALKDLESNIPTLEEKVKQSTSDLKNFDSEMSSVHRQLSEKSGRHTELKNSISSSTSRNRIMQFLTEQKRLGNISGVYGRLGDLGAIDKKYDIAISTACGPLDNIVTDTMDTAIKCTDLLKEHNVGSATFIALDKMDKSRYQDPISTPENVPRLFDLIKVNDSDVLPAFYFAIRDTLVADDLDQATRVGLGGRTRWRVVTLEGKMVETSGAMSGGGRPSSGRMGTSVVSSSDGDEKELRQLEKELSNLQEVFDEIKHRREMVVAEVKKYSADLDQMKRTKPQIEMDFKLVSDSQASLSNLIKEQEKTVATVTPDQLKVEALQKKVTDLEAVYEAKKQQVDEIQAKVKVCIEKIDEIVASKVGVVKKEIQSLTTRLSELNNKLDQNSVAIKMNSRNIEKSEEKIKKTESELESSKKLLEEINEEKKKLGEEAKELTEKYQAALETKEEMDEDYNVFMKSTKEYEKQEIALKSEIIDAKNELDEKQNLVDERSGNVNHWQAKINELKLKEIDGKKIDLELPVIPEDELEEMNFKTIEKEIETLKKSLASMKPNMGAIGEFKKKVQIWLERVKEFEEITAERDKIKEGLDKIENRRLEEFKEGFFIISRKLKEIYRALTSGGDAGLEWADSLNPFSEGIDFTVRPNKKTWKRITNLSGGEKTLSSLALIFAVHHFKPSPLYVMDEIDAALDFKNVSLVGHYVKQKTRNTQFLIISLRYNMYELADRLVGIYKTYNATKSVTVGLKKYFEINKQMPKNIVVYRDGVSEGQIQHVFENEVEEMRKAIERVREDENIAEKIGWSFIIVTKRIRARFFAKREGRFVNPSPGTAVDRDVTRRERFDFYMISQSVGQGTVSPTMYNIVEDTTGWRAKNHQTLAYKMCHLYFNWAGTVSVPAPCQYAHKLAYLTGTSLGAQANSKLSNNYLYFL